MDELKEQELEILIRLVRNLINANDTWENRELLNKLQRKYNDIYR